MEHLSARIVRGTSVQIDALLEQVDVARDLSGSQLNTARCILQLLFDGIAFQPQAVKPGPDLGRRQRAVAREVEEPFFLIAELGELFAKRRPRLVVGHRELVKCFSDLLPDHFGSVRPKLFDGHLLLNLSFDEVDPHRSGSAGATSLLAAADVVLVGAAVPLVLAVDQSTFNTTAFAVAAVQGTAEGLGDSSR